MKEFGKSWAHAFFTPETAVLAIAALAALMLAHSPLQALLLGICTLITAALRFTRKASLPPVRGLPEMKRRWLSGGVIAAVMLAACMLILGRSWSETASAALALLIVLLPGGVSELTAHAARHTVKLLTAQGLHPRDASVPNKLALTSVLCAEQTGWLTAKPRVIAVAAPFEFTGVARFRRQNSAVLTATAMALTADFFPHTGEALADFAAPMGYEGARLRKRMVQEGEPVALSGGITSVCYREGSRLQMFLAGDAEGLLQLCDRVANVGEQPLKPEEKAAWNERFVQAREQGMQPIAFAMKQASHAQESPEHAVLLGVALVADEPLPDVEEALRTCRGAGIRTVMFSEGDRESARLAAHRLALLTPGERVVDGQDMARMDDMRLREEVRNISVCAGLTAAQKQRVITAWQSWGAAVTCAGMPLAADLTVGSDADSLLHQDEPSLPTLVTGIALARRMRGNQSALVQYLAATALGGGIAAILLGLTGALTAFTPLLAALYGLIVRGIAALPLTCNSNCRSVMCKPPQDEDAALADAPMVFRVLTHSMVLGLSVFVASLLTSAAVFPALGLGAILLMPASFSAVRTAFRRSLRPAWLRAGIGCIAVIAASVLSLMLSQGTMPDWLKLICGAGLGIFPLLAIEVMKLLGCTGEKLRLTERKCK